MEVPKRQCPYCGKFRMYYARKPVGSEHLSRSILEGYQGGGLLGGIFGAVKHGINARQINNADKDRAWFWIWECRASGGYSSGCGRRAFECFRCNEIYTVKSGLEVNDKLTCPKCQITAYAQYSDYYDDKE